MLRNHIEELEKSLKDCIKSFKFFDGVENPLVQIKFTQAVNTKIEETISKLAKYNVAYILKFNKCNLGDKEVGQIIKNLINFKINLTVLNLDYNKITNDSAEAISFLIKNSTLNKLLLRDTLLQLGKSSLTAFGIEKIIPAVLDNKTLTMLALSGQAYDEIQMRVIHAVMERNNFRFQHQTLSLLNSDLQSKVSRLEDENKLIGQKLEDATDTIAKMDKTHSQLFLENINLESRLRFLGKDKENAIIKVQTVARGFFAKKKLKDEEIKRRAEIELYIKNKKQEIHEANSSDDLDTVFKLASQLKPITELYKQGKLHNALKKIQGKNEIEVLSQQFRRTIWY